jgi:tellurite resistance protein
MATADLLGTTWTTRPGGDGRFHCPRCHGERDFTRTELRHRLVVLGRTWLPLGPARPFLTCADCGHAFPADDLPTPASAADPQPVLSEDERALLSILAAVVFSDSAVRSAEKRGVAAVVRHYLPEAAGLDVNDLLRSARRRWGDPIDRLQRLRGLVDEDRRRRIVEAAYLVCTADGELHSEESRLLDRVGAALDLSPRLVRRAVSEARQQSPGRRGG